MAEAQGISVSEVIRSMVAAAIYGTASSIDEGYTVARQLAAQLAHRALQGAIEALPTDFNEAMATVGHPKNSGRW